MPRLFVFDLQLFADGFAADGGAVQTGDTAQGNAMVDDSGQLAAGATAPGQAMPEQPEQPETQQTPPQKTPQQRKAEFDKLIKEEYKDLYDQRVKSHIDRRFRETGALKQRLEAADPVMTALATKYGVPADDAAAILRALDEDTGYLEQEAAEKGVSVEQLRNLKKLEAENAQFRADMERRQREQQQQQQWAEIMRQGDALKAIHPNFDLDSECTDPDTGERFLGLIAHGLPVRTAYEAVHLDDIVGGAMQYTAKTIEAKTVNDIQARGLRPRENGTSGNAAARVAKKDPSTFTRADREDISRRVARGERIEF